MSTGVSYWSQTAATNASSDSAINWSEGQAPSSVNDSARAMMASIAKWRDDNNGSITTSGTSTAYTLTTNQGTGGSPPNGFTVSFKVNQVNGTPVTLAIDGGSAKPLRKSPGVEIPASFFSANGLYAATYFTSTSEWIVYDCTPIVIPAPTVSTLGGVKSSSAAAHQFATGIDTSGNATYGQPAAADLTCTTTNDNAATGAIGEVIGSNIASGSAVSVSNGVATNITSISLTAGDWDVYGSVFTNPAGSTTTSGIYAGISTSTGAFGTYLTKIIGLSVGAGGTIGIPAPTVRISLASTTTVYLVGSAGFATSTMTMYGSITARRVR
jgi:hypothetical protein